MLVSPHLGLLTRSILILNPICPSFAFPFERRLQERPLRSVLQLQWWVVGGNTLTSQSLQGTSHDPNSRSRLARNIFLTAGVNSLIKSSSMNPVAPIADKLYIHTRVYARRLSLTFSQDFRIKQGKGKGILRGNLAFTGIDISRPITRARRSDYNRRVLTQGRTSDAKYRTASRVHCINYKLYRAFARSWGPFFLWARASRAGHCSLVCDLTKS